MNYKNLTTKELLILNFKYKKCNDNRVTIIWKGNKMLNTKTEIVKVRAELETR